MPRLWPGSTVAIFATGPSLTLEDVNQCRASCHCIAVNDAHRLAPWAEVLYSSDQRWWPHHKGVKGFTGLKYGIAPRGKIQHRFAKYPDILCLENTGHSGLELSPTGLRTGCNSGYAAINLAVHFGAQTILLLGYNMGPVGSKTHFFGHHSGLSNTSPYHNFLRLFPSLVEPLERASVKVFNCTPGTRLHCFPERLLTDVLPASSLSPAC